MKRFISLLSTLIILFCIWEHSTLTRMLEGASSYFHSRSHVDFYRLDTNKTIEEITDKLINDSKIPSDLKKPLIAHERRIYIFKYPSGKEMVAGYISLISGGEHPTVLFLRGGNGNYGILRPNNSFSYLEGYNVIGTLYRGNLYGGNDEFGGQDIDDVTNLIKFIPSLEQETKSKFAPPYSMIGTSRGAMQMFVSLSRSDEIKKTVNKAISLSGNLDLEITSRFRPEMNALFQSKFKEQKKFHSFQDWLDYRNPMHLSNQLNPNLTVLMIYGLKDNRVPLQEQMNFLQALHKNQIHASLAKIPNAQHDMGEHTEEVKKLILNFLNKKSQQ